jgi:hypothetical protein
MALLGSSDLLGLRLVYYYHPIYIIHRILLILYTES